MYQFYECKNKCFDIDIIMLAYNHERFIGQAIESVIKQKTNYKYRILIGEDCSTDRTRKIVMSYYEKYPDKIALVLWNFNVGGSANACQLMQLSNSRYIGALEGDDYWTDPCKLEKQISFLEKHKKYIATAHNVRCVNEKGELLHRDFNAYPIREEHIYGIANALSFDLVAHVSSIVFRNFMKNWTRTQNEKFWSNKANGDMKISIFLGLLGDVYYSHDIMGDHRRVFSGDSWTAKMHNRNLLWFTYSSYKETERLVHEILGEDRQFENPLESFWKMSYERLLQNFNWENFLVFFRLSLEKLVKKYSK